MHIFSLLRNMVFIRAKYIQNSRNFEIIATEIELLNKYLIQLILLKQLFKSFDLAPKSRRSDF
jgi:hypothetical protein